MIGLLLNRWVQLAAVAAIAAFFFWRWQVQVKENGRIEAAVAMQVGETKEALDANATNQTTITTLEQKIEAMLRMRRLEARQREQALAARDRELLIAQRVAEADRRERDEIFRSTPDCEALASLDVDAACPALGRRLRLRSTDPGGHRDPNGGGAGRGGETPPSNPH